MGEFHMYYDKEGKPIEFLELARLAELPDYRYIARNHFKDGSYISTIWIGMRLYEGDMRIFETMYFPAEGSPNLIGRWETVSESIQEHELALADLIKAGYEEEVMG